MWLGSVCTAGQSRRELGKRGVQGGCPRGEVNQGPGSSQLRFNNVTGFYSPCPPPVAFPFVAGTSEMPEVPLLTERFW